MAESILLAGFPPEFIEKCNTLYKGVIYQNKGFAGAPVQLRIRVPKGTHAIYAEPFSAFGHGGKRDWDGYAKQSTYSQEDEIILQRGLKMQILNFAAKSDTLFVHAEILP